MRNRLVGSAIALLLITCVLPWQPVAEAQSRRREARERPVAGSESDFAAKRLLDRANDLLLANEHERGVKILETILDQYPSSKIRYQVYIALGKHYMDTNSYLKAINYLRYLKQLREGDEDMAAEDQDLYLEGLYLTGVSYFQMRQYGSAFPVLRKITTEFPNTVWSNQAYYYIGMCHFTQGNWTKAIEALSVVGTFVDPDADSVQYVEAGRRFYVKVVDADLPVLHRLGKEIKLNVQGKSGDKEVITLIPLSSKAEIFIGSIPTELGAPKAGDDRLQVVGGDSITTSYVDNNTISGDKDVNRDSNVRVVSTASVGFTLGDYASRAEAAFIGQPVFVQLQDADMDTTGNADSVEVRVVSRFVEEEEDDDAAGGLGIDIDSLFRSDEKQYVVRDEVVLKVTEIGESPVRTGKFAAALSIKAFREDQPISKNDSDLVVAIGDEILVTYIDDLHIQGDDPRQISSMIKVVSEIDGRPRPVQYVVPDPVVRAQKHIVESEAYLELGRIFKSMGLMDGASEKCDEGLARVDEIIRSRSPLPRDLVENAFKLKWELYLVKGNLNAAISTCQVFNRLYPDSPFVDQALLKIGMIRYEQKQYDEAINIFRQILRLNVSNVKAEAQFRIAEAMELGASQNRRGGAEAAIAAYKITAEKYPDSEFAGVALAKLVDYYITTKDYAQANDLLGQVFEDYPDADFLDSMLLKWVMVAYRMGNYDLAYEKCSELIFEYPSSRFAERAKKVLPQIEKRVDTSSSDEG